MRRYHPQLKCFYLKSFEPPAYTRDDIHQVVCVQSLPNKVISDALGFFPRMFFSWNYYTHTNTPIHLLPTNLLPNTVSILHSLGLFLSEHKQNIFFFYPPLFSTILDIIPYIKYISFSIQSHLKLSVKLSVKTFLLSISLWNANKWLCIHSNSVFQSYS